MNNKVKENLTLIEIIKSVLMSFLGVQRGDIRERDFNRGKAYQFIIVGLLLTLCLILLILSVVKLILFLAGN